MNKEQIDKMNEMIIQKAPQAQKAINDMRKDLNMKGGDMNPENLFYGLERVKCSEAEFFPSPPSIWKESAPLLYTLLADDWRDYMRCWTFKGIRVLASAIKYQGWEWLHVSFSRQNRIPDYFETQLVRANFIGEDKKSIMVFPSKDHYVNQHKNCLHLWYSKDNPIPDFDIYIPGLGQSV